VTPYRAPPGGGKVTNSGSSNEDTPLQLARMLQDGYEIACCVGGVAEGFGFRAMWTMVKREETL